MTLTTELFLLRSLKKELNGLLDGFKLGIRMDSVESNTRKLSTENILDDMTAIETTVYSSVVCMPSYYTFQRKLRKENSRSVLYKFAGIPFALLYGMSLYLLLRYMSLSQVYERDIHSTINVTNAINVSERVSHTTYFAGEHRIEHVYASSVFTATISIASIFSRGTRCSLLLMLPCVLTGRSRAILYTFIMGLLADGPINNIAHNFNEISKNMVCTSEAITRLARTSMMKLNNIYKVIKGVRQTDEDTLPLQSSFPQVLAIKQQLLEMQNGMSDFQFYIDILRKTLTILSIIWMIMDSRRYLRLYYSDNSFDNMYISSSVRQLWKMKGYRELIPLRHWELNDGYRMSSSAKFTKKELRKGFHKTIPTIIFSIFGVLTMLTDYLLAEMLQAIKDKKPISISFAGTDKDFEKLMKDILNKFYTSVSKCGTHPIKTSINMYITISTLLLMAAMSCIFEVYFSRIRSRMCDVFYTERAQERADYLHYRINAGRINRRVQLKLTIRRALEKQKRLGEFSLCSNTPCCLALPKHRIICPGCNWKVDVSLTKDIYFTLGVSTINNKLCNDCYLDT